MSVSTSFRSKLEYCWERQKKKYKWLGKAKYFSLLQFTAMFTLVPQLLANFWPLFEHSLSPIPLYFCSTVIFNLIVIVIYHLFMYIIYTRKIPFFEQYRCQPNLKWPWDQNPQQWKEFFKKTLTVDLNNSVILAGILTYTDSLIRLDVKISLAEAPTTATMFWQIAYFLFVEEILFYVFHRTLHHPKLYFLHKRHHQYKHTVCLSFVYSSPVEHTLNLLASGLAYKILSRVYPVHIFTVIVWIMYRVIQSMDGHSGYDFPWAITHLIPFSAGGNYHSFHHSKNMGNFGGALHFMDTFCGTNTYFRKLEEGPEGKEYKSS